MKKNEMRDHIFRIIFQMENADAKQRNKKITLYLESLKDISNKEFTYIKKKTEDIFMRIEEIDATIESISTGWKINRLGKAELVVLRVAVYEMKYDDDIPEKVAINEAVELAKHYGNEQSPRFVNGVLAKLATE